MIYEYHADDDETAVILNGKEQGRLSGRPKRWRGPIPHPDTEFFDEFETIVRQMSTPDERELMLHLLAGNVDRVGF